MTLVAPTSSIEAKAIRRPGNPWLAEDTFLAAAQDLFWKQHGAERESYEQLIYALAPPAPKDLVQRMVGFRGGDVPALGKDDAYSVVASVMRRVRYPDTEVLLECAKVDGLELPALSSILHFHHPAYPLYSQAAVEALNRMGHPVVWHPALDETGAGAFAGFIAAIDRLKVRIHYTEVPESNCFLTRVVEAALTGY